MYVEVLDQQEGRYRCEFGEFSAFPDEQAEAVPVVAAFSHWALGAQRFRRRTVEDAMFVDVEHQGQVWTYELEQAWTTVPGERCGVLFELALSFDVGVLPD